MTEWSRDQRSIVIGAGVFALGAFDAFQGAGYLVAAASATMAIANLVALLLVNESPARVQVVLFALNAAMAWLMAYETAMAGKQWLPYAWAGAGVVFLFAGWKKQSGMVRNVGP